MVLNESTDNSIGGIAVGEGNQIAYNGDNGVTAVDTGTPSTGNSILGNDIFGNTGLGIDLTDDGVTPNDSNDLDSGQNRLQNFPTIDSVVEGSVAVQGTLDSLPNSEFILEFFSTSVCDQSGNGEGRFFVGRVNVFTGGAGQASFDETFPVSVVGVQYISATATEVAGGDTSEFSPCVLPAGSSIADLAVAKTADQAAVVAGTALTYSLTVTNEGPDTATGVVVADTLPATLSFQSASAGCTESSGLVTCSVGTLANGQSATVDITAVVSGFGTVVNGARVVGNEPDSDDGDTQATVSTNVLLPPGVPGVTAIGLLLGFVALTATVLWTVRRKGEAAA